MGPTPAGVAPPAMFSSYEGSKGQGMGIYEMWCGAIEQSEVHALCPTSVPPRSAMETGLSCQPWGTLKVYLGISLQPTPCPRSCPQAACKS